MPAMIAAAADAAAAGEGTAAMTVAPGMRRVASAPAFKHANAYQAPCAALAEAQAQAQAEAAAVAAGNAAPGSTAASSQQSGKRTRLLSSWGSSAAKRPAGGKPGSSCSTCPGGRCSCLEVYVVSRAFTEFAGDFVKRLPQETREHMIDVGLCHYMTVFKTPDGQLVQFDFGPRGGDVQKAHGPVATLLKRAHAAALAQTQQLQQPQLALAGADAGSSGGTAAASSGRGMVHSTSMPVLPLASVDLAGEAGEAARAALQGHQAPPQRRKKGVTGEIRERRLDALPAACMYMGRTHLSLADIRRYNSAQGNMYTLHDNDCRHYVNSLVQYATGVERSTQHLKRHYFSTRHVDKWLWYGWLISATQLMTDVGNWGHIQAGAAVTLLAVTGRSTLAQLKTFALPVMPALSKSLPSLIPSAAGAGTGGAAAAGGLATTLKLPAALLLKRPLAFTAAGGMAAAIRTVPMCASDAAAAAASSSGGSSGGGAAGFGGLGGWVRPLRQWGDGIGRSIHGAVLSLRRAAAGRRSAAEQQHPAPAMAAAAAPGGQGSAATGGSSYTHGGWFGRNSASRQLAVQAAGSHAASGAAAPAAVMALPGPLAAAPSRRSSSSSSSGVRSSSCGQQQPEATPRRERGNLLMGLGQHVGRHVKWLGSTTGTIAVLASQQVGYLIGARNSSGVAAAAAALGGSTMSDLLRQHTPQQQQQRGVVGQRGKSACSLAVVAAAAPVAPGTAPAQANGPAADAGSVSTDGLDELIYVSGSSSVTCNSVSGRPSGVGRQVLNLPAPRISWGRRASHAMIVGQ